MCMTGFELSVKPCAARHTYAWRVGSQLRVGKKLSYSTVSNYIDTQGRGVQGPEKRGLERLFNITSNYITVRWHV